jgi:hypothetical protein
MTSDECRAKAVDCYQAAQKTTDYEARRGLLDLVVQWRELAAIMDQLIGDDPPSPIARTLH